MYFLEIVVNYVEQGEKNMKTKYNDNRLAEEFDLIILTSNAHEKRGLPQGSLGTLTYSYTGAHRPMYGQFEKAGGEKVEEALAFPDFRVLNERNENDLTLILHHLIAKQPIKSHA